MKLDLSSIVNEVVKKIINMEDGSVSTIEKIVEEDLTISELFKVQEMVIEELKKYNVELDYSEHNDKFEGLSFNLEFVKKTNSDSIKKTQDTIWVFKDEEDRIVRMNVVGEYEYLGGLDTIDLMVGKIYKRVEDENDFRIVDESGEDYIYPYIYFKEIK